VNAFQIHQTPRDDVLQPTKSFEDRVTGTEPIPKADKTVARIDVRVKDWGCQMNFNWDRREESREPDLGRMREKELSRCAGLDDAASLAEGNSEKIFLQPRMAVQNVNDGSIQ
jgi:hypothetical protein